MRNVTVHGRERARRDRIRKPGQQAGVVLADTPSVAAQNLHQDQFDQPHEDKGARGARLPRLCLVHGQQRTDAPQGRIVGSDVDYGRQQAGQKILVRRVEDEFAGKIQLVIANRSTLAFAAQPQISQEVFAGETLFAESFDECLEI